MSETLSVENDTGENRISNIPDEVIDHVLSYLPVKEAVKTGLLSRMWRNKWRTVPCLVFNAETLPLVRGYQTKNVRKLVADIDRVLLLHSGLLCKFGLSYEGEFLKPHVGDIDRWILLLSKNPIKEFQLDMQSFKYTMPSCLFAFQNLTDLDLTGCLLNPPPTFSGFKGLKRLNLETVSLKQDMFESLTSGSMLENLSLNNVAGSDHFNIKAPNLKILNFKGPCTYLDEWSWYDLIVDAPNLLSLIFAGPSDYLVLKNTSHLAELDVWTPEEHPGDNATLLKLVASNMPRLERLQINCLAFASPEFGEIPRALPEPYLNLRYMSLTSDFTCSKEFSGLVCFLRSAPSLQHLVIRCFNKSKVAMRSNVLEGVECLTRLRHFEMFWFGQLQAEIDFIRFMLLTSPVLTDMILHSESSLSSDITDQIHSLRCASPHARILIKDDSL